MQKRDITVEIFPPIVSVPNPRQLIPRNHPVKLAEDRNIHFCPNSPFYCMPLSAFREHSAALNTSDKNYPYIRKRSELVPENKERTVSLFTRTNTPTVDREKALAGLQ